MGNAEHVKLTIRMNSSDDVERKQAIREAKGRCPEIIPDLVKYLDKGKNTRPSMWKSGFLEILIGGRRNAYVQRELAEQHPQWRFCHSALIVLRDHVDHLSDQKQLIKELSRDYHSKVSKAAKKILKLI